MKIGDLFIKLGLQKGEFDKGIDDAKRKTSAFGSAMKKVGGMIGGVFAAGSIINFGRELLNIAGQAEGVQKAFNKIATAGDLQSLRNATKNTVSDLELMKRAVSANNFDIPVQQLGRLFEFAAKRAQDTGQSVDYLVDSIVVGIGRKSPLILDNLGISAIQLREKLGGVGMETATVAQLTKAVGDIAEESFQKSGKFADTLGTKIVSLSVKWENFKLSLSTNEGFVEFWKGQIDEVDKAFTIFFSKNLTKWEKFRSAIDIFDNETDFLYNKAKNAEYVDQFLKQQDAESSGGPLDTPKKVVTLTERIKKLNQIIAETRALMKPGTDVTAMKGYHEDIQKAQEELKLLNEISGQSDAKFKKGSIGYLEEEIKLIGEKIQHETDPQKLGALQKELRVKQDILKIEKDGLKFMESKSMKNKDIAELFTKGIKTEKGTDTSKLIISPEMKANMFNSEEYAAKEAQGVADAEAFVDELNQTLSNGIANAISTMSSGFADLIAGDIGIEEFGQNILAVIGQFLVQMGEMLIAYGVGMEAFKKAFTNPWAAIAAGAALVFIGSSISGMAKSGPGGGSAATAASGYSNYSQSSGAAVLSGNVVFELDGYKLKGALNNADRRNTLIR